MQALAHEHLLSPTHSTHTCTEALIAHWITYFGIPIDYSLDWSSQFTSQLWAIISQWLGTKLHHTTTYHQQSNSLVEQFHQHLKSALHACLSGPHCWTSCSGHFLGTEWPPPSILQKAKFIFVQQDACHMSLQYVPSKSSRLTFMKDLFRKSETKIVHHHLEWDS